ncbi:acyl-CoA thioesterase [Coemansia sp. RSA 989]|nr:HotDog domain-containing protein [Coemansia mojavensis]KAJ1742904.1 acyl-CoA thioesterase [Coemansia sp. RSA 1086]KAJ1749298.1 acyl-CoA thioesterase [Coemansia sp. RSA 1821]KAJ1866075.1 acyl-CoA thioesterase [Coemansia sp. RSA 989]KAJ2631398.1 acyl-CoA thioesterase [Coemansia sp. RSA 1290]KAJ2648148.1 acyl-CoA thioesterase [Coemansia sp. RSA 1250]KAJ2669944.1 acyl-CoA thioesterase [Coemansia sp. RSA 1085]
MASEVKAEEDTNLTTFNERTLELEEIGPDTFLSVDLWQPRGNRGVFGGQVVGQALSAAGKTVDSPFRCNSLHCYFLAAGKNSDQIAYEVRRIRQGKSYCTRLVVAKQNGRVIFIATVSFQRCEASTLRHQYVMPKVPAPETLISREEYLRRQGQRINNAEIDEAKIAEYGALPVESRIVPQKSDGLPVNAIWMRAKGDMSGLGHMHHQSMLAYASDFALIGTSTRPYQKKDGYDMEMLVSLDHTIWFHEPFRADEWLLYVMESPRAAGGRALATGRIYSRDGVLVASTAQEGVLRGKGPTAQTLQFASSVTHTPAKL